MKQYTAMVAEQSKLSCFKLSWATFKQVENVTAGQSSIGKTMIDPDRVKITENTLGRKLLRKLLLCLQNIILHTIKV